MIISLSIFTLYIAFILIKFGLIPSISQSYYELEKIKKGYGWIFTFWAWGVTFFLLPTLLDYCSENTKFLAFLTAMGLCFVGIAPRFKTFQKYIHFISAGVCLAGSFLIIIFNASLLLIIASGLIYLSAILIGVKYKKDILTLLIELAAFTSLYLSL